MEHDVNYEHGQQIRGALGFIQPAEVRQHRKGVDIGCFCRQLKPPGHLAHPKSQVQMDPTTCVDRQEQRPSMSVQEFPD